MRGKSFRTSQGRRDEEKVQFVDGDFVRVRG
jgi:hypothetical protein